MKRVYNYVLGLVDLILLYSRINIRGFIWSKCFKKYKLTNASNPPFPAIVQVIPTEKCNLRCPMCNQWGDNGYLVTGKRSAAHSDIVKLKSFLKNYKDNIGNYTLSVHGGEPFAYHSIKDLLGFIFENKLDTVFSTNGTYLGQYAKELAKINRHAMYLLSIDGGEDTHDKIRGKGVSQKIIDGLNQLQYECIHQNTGNPKVIINYCVCEHNLGDLEKVISFAKKLRAWVVNYNYRWFMPESAGHEYDKILEEELQVRPTQAWVGWVTNNKFENIAQTMNKLFSMKRLLPPYITRLPRFLNKEQSEKFYLNHDELFGIKSCIMPSYWARIHSSGELIYCPGHPDVVPGNVFDQPFEEIFLNKISRKLRKRVEQKLFPICNRCCGLYMTYSATKHLGDGFISDNNK